MSTERSISGIEAILLTALFCAAICAPLVKQLVIGEPPTLSLEARPLNTFPVLSHATSKGLRKYATDFEDYYNDHFGFRSALLSLGSFVDVKGLDVSPAKNVEIGKSGWLFLKDNITYHGTVDVRPGDLEHWRQVIERRQAWLAKRGILYIYVMAPNKRSIYPDYLSDALNATVAETSLEQFDHYLAAHSSSNFLSLQGALQKAREKQGERLYFPSDTHWNTIGAYFGYREIILRLQQGFPALKPIELSEFRVSHEMHNGDLARMIGFTDYSAGMEATLTPRISPETSRTGFKLPDVEQTEGTLPFKIKNPAAATKLRVVVMRDSFGTALFPFLVSHFAETTSIWSTDYSQKFEKDLADVIEKEKPDIFIEERVERVLAGGSPPVGDIFGGDDNP